MATRRRARRKSILGNLTDVERRLRYLEKRPAPSRLSNKVVGTDNIKPFAVSTDIVQDQAVTTVKVADLAIETEKIDNQAVTNEKLAENAVQSLQIAPNAVGTEEISNTAVTNDKLAGSITADKISTVNSDSLQGIIDLDLIPNLPASKTTSGTFDLARIPSLPASQTTSGQFDSARIPNLSATKITSDQFDAARIPNLDAAKITTGTFNSEARIPGLPASKITSGTFATARIADLAITTAKINGLAVATGKIADLAVTAEKIGPAAVTNAKLSVNAVAGANIQTDAVTGVKIADNTIPSTKIPGSSFVVLLNNNINVQDPLTKFVGQGFYNLRVSVGTGANQVAAGNHSHTGGGTVAAHTHPATVNVGSIFVTSGGQQLGGASPPPISLTNHQHPYSRVIGVSVNQNTSTKRLKKEIQDYEVQDLDKLLKLKLKKFKYKREVKHLHPNREWMYGYMAEDLIENGFEEVIGYDNEGNPFSVNYGLMSIFVLELVKKQQNEIDSLKEEIQRLKEKI